MVKSKAKIALITMGGTLDSMPYPHDDYPSNATMMQVTLAPLALRKSFRGSARNIDALYGVTRLSKKDSKDINRFDRRKLLDQIICDDKNGAGRIVVTMGTDHLCETAQWLESELKRRRVRLSCPVVFTGAIWPLSNGKRSDGWKNVENAVLAEPKVAPGVYVTMNDVVMARASTVYKNQNWEKGALNKFLSRNNSQPDAPVL